MSAFGPKRTLIVASHTSAFEVVLGHSRCPPFWFAGFARDHASVVLGGRRRLDEKMIGTLRKGARRPCGFDIPIDTDELGVTIRQSGRRHVEIDSLGGVRTGQKINAVW